MIRTLQILNAQTKLFLIVIFSRCFTKRDSQWTWALLVLLEDVVDL